MPALLLELFSEEIPARMQARAAADLGRLLGEALAPLAPREVTTFHGPRRIAFAATLDAGVAESRSNERGPRVSAPEQALAGFLRKHAATRDELRQEGEFWLLDRLTPGVAAAALVASVMPGLLRRFPWPKSMRWGAGSQFTWVRPLRRILCLLDGEVVPFTLAQGEDDGHGLASGDLSEGHRFLSPGAFAVTGAVPWQAGLLARHVVADAAERRRIVAEGIARAAAALGLTVVDDPGLLDEVAGLVEWPVALTGRIDAAFMDLPPEVMQVSMRVNQRYFALRHPDGTPAPHFAFAANIAASDGGAAIVAGNERVLRARFSDARHFWDLDRAQTLESRVPALDRVTFHAKLGSQGDRVRRLVLLAHAIAPMVGADPEQAARAALLAKADLVTGMVGEFPELQGVMGGYYARHDGEDAAVADAVRDHYAPKGVSDPAPSAPVTVAVALADKIDQLVRFFSEGEKPTGSGDPFALRRAGLGIIRIIRENAIEISLTEMLQHTGSSHVNEVKDFLFERLRVQFRAEGGRHDVLAAVLDADESVSAFMGQNTDNIVSLLTRTQVIDRFLDTDEGADLLTAYKRANNILDKESRFSNEYSKPIDAALFTETAEAVFNETLQEVDRKLAFLAAAGDLTARMKALAELRQPIDKFLTDTTIVTQNEDVTANRLRLLRSATEAMNRVADFSLIQG